MLETRVKLTLEQNRLFPFPTFSTSLRLLSFVRFSVVGFAWTMKIPENQAKGVIDNTLIPDEVLISKIYFVREQKVMLDSDLAAFSYSLNMGYLGYRLGIK